MVISELFKINYENGHVHICNVALRRLRQDKTFKASLEKMGGGGKEQVRVKQSRAR